MARAKKRTTEVEKVRPYVEGVAKNLVEKLYGPAGPAWGTTLTEIEDLLLAVREVLSEKMLSDALARQAASQTPSPAAYGVCPGCAQPLDCRAGQERTVRTRVGKVAWTEPAGYCDRCRRSFFPSVEEPGH